MSIPDEAIAQALSEYEQTRDFVHYYRMINDPNLRAGLLHLMIMVSRMDESAALELIEEYFPLVDMIRERERLV